MEEEWKKIRKKHHFNLLPVLAEMVDYWRSWLSARRDIRTMTLNDAMRNIRKKELNVLARELFVCSSSDSKITRITFKRFSFALNIIFFLSSVIFPDTSDIRLIFKLLTAVSWIFEKVKQWAREVKEERGTFARLVDNPGGWRRSVKIWKVMKIYGKSFRYNLPLTFHSAFLQNIIWIRRADKSSNNNARQLLLLDFFSQRNKES